MKEYRIQLFATVGNKWVNFSEYYKYPIKTEENAKEELRNRQEEHPGNRYRIISREVSEWEEVEA